MSVYKSPPPTCTTPPAAQTTPPPPPPPPPPPHTTHPPPPPPKTQKHPTTTTKTVSTPNPHGTLTLQRRPQFQIIIQPVQPCGHEHPRDQKRVRRRVHETHLDVRGRGA